MSEIRIPVRRDAFYNDYTPILDNAVVNIIPVTPYVNKINSFEPYVENINEKFFITGKLIKTEFKNISSGNHGSTRKITYFVKTNDGEDITWTFNSSNENPDYAFKKVENPNAKQNSGGGRKKKSKNKKSKIRKSHKTYTRRRH